MRWRIGIGDMRCRRIKVFWLTKGIGTGGLGIDVEMFLFEAG